MRPTPRPTLPAAIAAGFLVGLLGNALWSADPRSLDVPVLAELRQLTRLEPVRVLPRTELAVATLRARAALGEGRPWHAWRLLRDEIDGPHAAPEHVLLAARAASEWEGWGNVRRLLHGRRWLDSEPEGLFLLARAEEALGNRGEAAALYRSYLTHPGARERGAAQARLGRVLRRAADHGGAAAAFGAARDQLPEIEDWLRTLQVEELAAARDPAALALATRGGRDAAPARLRRALAEAEARRAAGDLAQAVTRLEWEARVLRAQRAVDEAARLQLEQAGLQLQLGRRDEARALLRTVAWEGRAAAESRLEAARRLGEIEGLTASDELARVAAYEAANRPGLAARSLRAAMAAGAPDDASVQLKLARLLFRERDFGPARVAFRRAAESLQEPELVAEAHLYAARSLYLGGGRARWDAIAEFRRVTERFPGTAAAGTAYFLLGDASSNLERGLSHYRRAAAVRHSPDAREALYRVGDRYLRLKNPTAALRAWGEYVERYPRGEETARVAYTAGRLHERAGREARARALYLAALRADPVSYYAVRAAQRVGTDPLRGVLAEPRPWVGLASDAGDAAATLRRLQALERVGLRDEWQAELDAAVRGFEERPAALLALAEGLRDQARPVEAIRIGRRLLERRGGEWDARLLQVVFPLVYRPVLEAEAERSGIDPMLLAGLVRQESSFRHDARSRVGATGLGQIMPRTGAWLARHAGIRTFDEQLLEVPEVNLRMSAVYLEDLLDRYDGAADLALAAYNAGPSRADRWRRELGYRRESDDFREAIPFKETREYVKLVLRNQAVYTSLYGRPR